MCSNKSNIYAAINGVVLVFQCLRRHSIAEGSFSLVCTIVHRFFLFFFEYVTVIHNYMYIYMYVCAKFEVKMLRFTCDLKNSLCVSSLLIFCLFVPFKACIIHTLFALCAYTRKFSFLFVFTFIFFSSSRE